MTYTAHLCTSSWLHKERGHFGRNKKGSTQKRSTIPAHVFGFRSATATNKQQYIIIQLKSGERAGADGVLCTVRWCDVCCWPLEVFQAGRDGTEAVAGQIELRQSLDLTQRLREDAQPIVRKIQAPQLGKSAEICSALNGHACFLMIWLSWDTRNTYA